ncbi:MAG: Coenzyme F420 hydrogenase/dehydrogenase, beta subunit C-terminal domain [Desulfomonilaceae bacterium]
MTNFVSLNELKRRVLDKGLCCACGGCVGGCPYLVAFKGKTVVLDACAVANGRCYAACPVLPSNASALTALVFGESRQATGIGIYHSVLACKAIDARISSMGQGGGAVTALVAHILKQGLVDCAILTAASVDDAFPGGIVVGNAEEAYACAGSKYVGAHSLSALRKALDMGKQAIAVVGLPCQVLSVRKMMLSDVKQEDIRRRIKLVVGLFCNWAFSAREFTAFLAERFLDAAIRRIHIPPPPANCLELETPQGIITISLEEVRPFIQKSCWQCPDMTSELADLSIGMYEGRPGWNTLVVRTDLGKEIIDDMTSSGVLETEVFPETNLAHLEFASRRKKERAPQPQSK